jgi:pyruvate kinase
LIPLAEAAPFNWFTLGPSSLPCIDELLVKGATGCRLTFSFGTPELQAERAGLLKKAANEVSLPCLVVADLPGGKCRLGEFVGPDSVSVRDGDRFSLQLTPVGNPSEGVLPIEDAWFLEQCRPGDIIVVGDGGAELYVETNGPATVTVVARGAGSLQHTRGVTLQSEAFSPAALTPEDVENLGFVARDERFDAVAISFVSSGADIERVQATLSEHGRPMPVVAKIETSGGVQAAEDIAQAADAVMIARGDLALALPWQELPAAVAETAMACNDVGTPWLVATQIAEGLERFTMPTRAEICDLAHWLGCGCSGTLLSFETVFGAKPLAAVAAVDRLIRRWYARD